MRRFIIIGALWPGDDFWRHRCDAGRGGPARDDDNENGRDKANRNRARARPRSGASRRHLASYTSTGTLAMGTIGFIGKRARGQESGIRSQKEKDIEAQQVRRTNVSIMAVRRRRRPSYLKAKSSTPRSVVPSARNVSRAMAHGVCLLQKKEPAHQVSGHYCRYPTCAYSASAEPHSARTLADCACQWHTFVPPSLKSQVSSLKPSSTASSTNSDHSIPTDSRIVPLRIPSFSRASA